MPASAGIQWLCVVYERRWTPAFAGVTVQALVVTVQTLVVTVHASVVTVHASVVTVQSSVVTVQSSVVTDKNLFATLDLRVRCNPHTQCVELDEATCVSLIIGAAIFIKGRNVHIKQRISF
jgi:hypothetical protein